MMLNLGSGQRPFAHPWVNVDAQERWSPDVAADIRSMPMFTDGSADIIVLHHVLEHFGCGEGLPCLRECHRILHPGGLLIVCVPNVRALVSRWIRDEEFSDQLFFTNLYGAYMGDEADRHKWGFTPESLYFEMQNAGPGFRLQRFDWRPIPGADIANDWWILAMEATK